MPASGPGGGFTGYNIELKAVCNKTTEQQEAWLMRLQTEGYAAVMCCGWQRARETLLIYLGLPFEEENRPGGYVDDLPEHRSNH